mgnify:CR=1 FL=1
MGVPSRVKQFRDTYITTESYEDYPTFVKVNYEIKDIIGEDDKVVVELVEPKPVVKVTTKKVVKKPITYVHQDDLEQDENAVEVEAVEEVESNE